jgi:hypothetical protein
MNNREQLHLLSWQARELCKRLEPLSYCPDDVYGLRYDRILVKAYKRAERRLRAVLATYGIAW